jgi:hypothetical protein
MTVKRLPVLLVKEEFLGCHEKKNFLRPPWEEGFRGKLY